MHDQPDAFPLNSIAIDRWEVFAGYPKRHSRGNEGGLQSEDYLNVTRLFSLTIKLVRRLGI